MGPSEFSNGVVRFGIFEVDLARAELRKKGLRVRLQEQPFQVLVALLERPGEVVSREDLIRRLWADGTVVDFDRGLNAAVNRLRQALSDSADVPRYVETAARRGYRFIGHIENSIEASQPPLPLATPHRKKIWAAGVLICIMAVTAAWWSFTRIHASRPGAELEVVPLTTGSGVERNPSFSPDGSQLVYEWEREDGTRHLYIKVVGPGDPIPLTSGACADYGPAWSPDGSMIAFLRQFDETTLGVFIVPPVGGVERKITETASPGYWRLQQFHRRLDWTPDSRHVVVSVPEHAAGPEGLLLVGINDGEKRWLSNPPDPLIGDREPAVSPDGSMVAFARGRPGADTQVYLLPLSTGLRPAGAPRPLTGAAHARSPAWTADGTRIVFASITPIAFGSGVSVVGVNSGAAPRRLLALGRNTAVPVMARTGRLAYSRVVMEGNIWRQEIPAGAGAVLPPLKLTDSSAQDFNAQYSPDGSRIAFASNRSGSREIWTCGSDGQHCIQATNFNGPFLGASPRWSPDSKSLVFDSGAAGQPDVYVVNANGGPSRRLTDDATRGMVPSWSHDGKWIYFCSEVTGRNEIWKIPSAGGKALQVTRDGGFVAFDSPDSTALYYTKTEQNAKLFRSMTDGRAETEVLSGVTGRGFVVADDRIYYLNKNRDDSVDIRRFMLATGEDSQIAPVAKRVYLGLGMSPDARYLIYSQVRVTSNLMLVKAFQ